MIQQQRLQTLKTGTPGGGQYVLYWMQASVRTTFNHALEYAIEQANELEQPLIVAFGLTPSYPEANQRSYLFLLEGLRDVQHNLEQRKIGFVMKFGHPPEEMLKLAQQASLVITDRAYLRPSRDWRTWLADQLKVPLIQVESDAVVPIETTSGKQEWAARTIRPKLHKLMDGFLVALEPRTIKVPSLALLDGVDVSDPQQVLAGLDIDRSVLPGEESGGEDAAQARLTQFITGGLQHYDERRNNPLLDGASRLSAYLHFGHLSPIDAVLRAREQGGAGLDAFVEELVVRRELSFNLCFYNPQYDQYAGLPDWCRKTLAEQESDEREYLYTRDELEAAQTHDPYWNAAQNQMVRTGRMHNYLRMYWGKKVLEWSETPQQAYEVLVYLNNKYEADGRNANSYAGINWVFGTHDRPWARRPIFGTVRYMVAGGLKRKFDADAYAKKWA
ncbi:deoxyribodipyrimidine photolyase [Deinococcus psychrotolerans]|uniref:Deoxyribodipyrimidine photo-lyase n=1 Tax=Deinococcus psychrotolerans TaxID=2489213 RepID=A0A3G8Y9G7_9DEIO|nr:deoxyribodipyrimidine photo-lyase [Deinococcus psychrotolerans]AZI41553.1 deoxyribodipyrimidine photolyase [Deinococcus psychrotolerans]